MSALINTLGDSPGQLVVPAHHGLVLPAFVSEGRTDIDFTDLFAGTGGSSIGLVAAGLNLTLTANLWKRAIETHATNFPNAQHLIADVSNYDFRRLPRTEVLWASPSCVWHSPAGVVYAEAWLESHGPILTIHGQYGTRHFPAHTGFGGYDLCGRTDTETGSEPV